MFNELAKLNDTITTLYKVAYKRARVSNRASYYLKSNIDIYRDALAQVFIKFLDNRKCRGKGDVHWEDRWFYIAHNGRLAFLCNSGKKKGEYQKYINLRIIDPKTRRACKPISKGMFVKHRALIQKILEFTPNAITDKKRQTLEEYFDPAPDVKMIIDMDFEKAYGVSYRGCTTTDGDLATDSSCMSGTADDAELFYGGIPCCKVARFEDMDGNQVGRCIVYDNGTNRHFIRVYGKGDYHRSMINAIRDEMRPGDKFGRNEEPLDILVETTWDDKTPTMYVDGDYGVFKSGGKYWFASDHYDITSVDVTDNRSLWAFVNDIVCDYCENAIESEDDMITIGDRIYCCEGCARDAGYERCEYCGEWIDRNNAIIAEVRIDGYRVTCYYCCEGCAERDGCVQCTNCGDWIGEKDAITVEPNSDVFCSDVCATEADYTKCDICGRYYHNEDIFRATDGNYICPNCTDGYVLNEDGIYEPKGDKNESELQ